MNPMNTITWTIKATRQLLKLQQQNRDAITSAVEAELTDLRAARHVKALKNFDYDYRLRVGNYRVFFNYDGFIKIVTIEEVKKRDDRTY
jgi:mRNA interferase RelE/StbE